MKKIVHFLVVSMGFAFGSAALAATTTTIIDFNELPDGNFNTPLLSKGFVIDPALSPFQPVITGGVDKYIIFCGWCQDGQEGISIYSNTALSFELDSLDVLFLNGAAHTGTVIGHLQGGGTISQSLPVVDSTVVFDSSWVNLASIDIVFDVVSGPANFAVPGLDNITLQAVPVPAAVWLFASALGAIGWVRRRSLP